MDITNSNSLKLTIQDLPCVIIIKLRREIITRSILVSAINALKEQILYNSKHDYIGAKADIRCSILNRIDDICEIEISLSKNRRDKK